MINNYKELEITLRRLDDQLEMLQWQIRKKMLNQEYCQISVIQENRSKLYQQQVNYLNHYKLKIKDNYLETKLFASKIANLEQNLKQPNLETDVIYCLRILSPRLEKLEKDYNYFLQQNKQDTCEIISRRESVLISEINQLLIFLSKNMSPAYTGKITFESINELIELSKF